ncbi:sarcosine oxidase subunit gamma [Cryobacterium sp. AP23]
MADLTALENPRITSPLRRSPAAHLLDACVSGSVAGSARLAELPFLVMVGIRVHPGADAGRRIAAVTGELPRGSGQVGGTAETAVLWLGPTEFLVVAPAGDDDAPELVDRLVDALADDPGQVVDLSANRTTFELSGPRARDVLEKGCSLDLHPRVLPPKTAVSTEVGGIPVLLWKTADETYRLLPRASFADFLCRWLLDGMREYATAGVA